MKRNLVCYTALVMSILLIFAITSCSTPSDSSKMKDVGNKSDEPSGTKTETGVGNEREEAITLTAFAMEGPYTKGDFNDLYIWKEYEKKSGIKVVFETAPANMIAEKLGLIFASNNLPDMFFKVGMSNADITRYAGEGSLIALDDYLDEYAPNFNGYLKDDESIGKNIRMEDGKIYGFPYLVTATASRITPKLLVNKIWLEQSGLEMPKTTDDLYEALKVFKDSDFNGNGQKDEIPLTSEYNVQLHKALLGSFGLLTRGAGNLSWDIDDSNGSLRYIRTSNSYKEFLIYLHKLYSEGLIDQEIITIDIPKLTASAQQNRIGFAFVGNNNYLGDYKDDFTHLPAPLIGPNGDQIFGGRTIPVAGQTAFITKTNKYPGETVKWIDYFYSNEGIALYFMGEEGKTFEYDAEGKPQFTDYVKNNSDGLSMEEVLGSYVVWSGGGNPSVADDLHFGNHLIPDISLDSANALNPYIPKEIWGSFVYSQEDSERLGILQQDIDTYTNEMTSKFVTGAADLTQWDSYLQEVERMGLKEYKEIVQRAYEKYQAK